MAPLTEVKKLVGVLCLLLGKHILRAYGETLFSTNLHHLVQTWHDLLQRCIYRTWIRWGIYLLPHNWQRLLSIEKCYFVFGGICSFLGRGSTKILLMVQKSGVHQLRLVVYPIIYMVLYLPGGAGVPPPTVMCKWAIVLNERFEKNETLKMTSPSASYKLSWTEMSSLFGTEYVTNLSYIYIFNVGISFSSSSSSSSSSSVRTFHLPSGLWSRSTVHFGTCTSFIQTSKQHHQMQVVFLLTKKKNA